MRPAAVIVAATLAFLPVGGPAQTGERQRSTVLMSESPRGKELQEAWGFSSAIVTGDTIYLSGIVVDAPKEGSDLVASYEQIYERIGSILKRAGASWDDVVDMTSFHTDVEGQIEAMVKAQKKYVKPPFPAWTAIGVSKILGNGITEIKITAKKPASQARK